MALQWKLIRTFIIIIIATKIIDLIIKRILKQKT